MPPRADAGHLACLAAPDADENKAAGEPLSLDGAAGARLSALCRRATIGALTGAMLHELASVVHCLRFSTAELGDVLRERGGVPGEVTELLAEVETASQRVVDLYRSVRRFLEDGPDASRSMVRCSAAELVEQALALCGPCRDLKARIRFLSAVEAQLECEPALIVQVLVELLRNAAEVSGPQGRIDVEIVHESGAVVFRVSDEGPPLSPERIEGLFEPCFSSDDEGDGTGLGLAFGAAVVRRHGGTMSFLRRAPVGSTFEVRLPVAAAVAAPA